MFRDEKKLFRNITELFYKGRVGFCILDTKLLHIFDRKGNISSVFASSECSGLQPVASAAINKCPTWKLHRPTIVISVSAVQGRRLGNRKPILSKFRCDLEELKNHYKFRNGWKFACLWFLQCNWLSTKLKIRFFSQPNLRLKCARGQKRTDIKSCSQPSLGFTIILNITSRRGCYVKSDYLSCSYPGGPTMCSKNY